MGNKVSGFVATVSATVWFDYFLTRPYEKLAITHRPDIETAVSLFVVGIIVTELAARNRLHHETAVEEADFVGLIHDVSELATSGAPSREVVERVRNELISLLHLQACRYESAPADQPMMRLEHDGRVFLGGRVWAVDRLGLPGREMELRVQAQGRALGRFVIHRPWGTRSRTSDAWWRSRSPIRSARPCDRCLVLACKAAPARVARDNDSCALPGGQKQSHEEAVGHDDECA